MYDPTIGRWISEDPIGFEGGDPNLYRYVGNSPTNFTDPDGLESRPLTQDEQAFLTQVIEGVFIPPEDNPLVVKERRDKAVNELRDTCNKVSLVKGPRNGMSQLALGPGGAAAVTLGGFVYFDKDVYPSPTDKAKIRQGDRREIEKVSLLSHEFTHVMQQRRFNHFIECYVGEGAVKDYMDISTEREAFAVGDAVRDLLRRDGTAYDRQFTPQDIQFLKDRYEHHKKRMQDMRK